MIVKLLLFICLLFVTVDTAKVRKNVSFSVRKNWQSYKKIDECCTCQRDDADEWKDHVQQCYDGIRQATFNFHGPSYNLAESALNSFEVYVSKLIYFANSNSTVLTSSSMAILEALSKCKKLESSGYVIIEEFDKTTSEVVQDFIVIVSKLSDAIGELTDPVNKALNDFDCTMKRFTNEFLMCNVDGLVKEVDYQPVIKEAQVFMNTIALIAETLLNDCKSATQDIYEAVTVLSLILSYVIIAIQGINCSAQTVWYEQERVIPENVEKSSVTLEYLLVEVTEAIAAVTFPFIDSITNLLTSLVNLTMFLNSAFKSIFGLFTGVAITGGQITKSLLKNVSGTVTGVSKGLNNILKGIVSKKL